MFVHSSFITIEENSSENDQLPERTLVRHKPPKLIPFEKIPVLPHKQTTISSDANTDLESYDDEGVSREDFKVRS